MNQPSRRAVLAGLGIAPLAAGALVVSSGTAHADSAPSTLHPGGEFDRYLTQLADADAFSGTVLVTRQNRTVLARSCGMADKARGVANGPDTIYALGSVTKLFTATAIHQLAEQGKLAYNATLGTYLPGFPTEIAGTVTIHQLLTHTSGVGRPAINPPVPPGQDQWTTRTRSSPAPSTSSAPCR